jgi:HAMP domain-containing protein
METALISSQRTHFSPPSRGLALGWRLALSTVLIISIVMGSISIGQQLLELEEQRQLQQRLLAMSLVPLAGRMEAAMNLEVMDREIEEFHTAYTKKGYPAHEIVLLDAMSEPVLSTGVSEDRDNDLGHFQAMIPIFSPLLKGGKGNLIVLKDSTEYRNAVRRDWQLWAVHFAVTLGVVFLFLAAAIYFQVTKPVNRLVRVVRKMERGYWKPIVLADGAWEIRWLAWRFGNMVQEVQNTMTHFLQAEQKARPVMPKRASDPLIAGPDRRLGPGITESDYGDDPAHRELLAVCDRLEASSPDHPQAAELGRNVWQQEAIEANRLGFYQTKARLEDAALRLMEPDAYRTLDDRLSELKADWQEWTEQQHEALDRLLEDSAIPCVGVLHRMKHTAGVWAKMESKEMSLDEIEDLFAFRIIVPTTADCYAVLGIIHQHYTPVITRFKDYVARPKENGYRSLHTCIAADNGPVFEIQIRSVAMDRQAERGGAAHWVYKKGARTTDNKSVVIRWWRKLLR